MLHNVRYDIVWCILFMRFSGSSIFTTAGWFSSAWTLPLWQVCALLVVAPPACSLRIGPYDSGDPDVLEYHLLLMRYAGVDGVLIDWYGSHKVRDYGPNLDNSEALISKMKPIGACAWILRTIYHNGMLWCCNSGKWKDEGERWMDIGAIINQLINVENDLFEWFSCSVLEGLCN